jgi:hypothetical protein
MFLMLGALACASDEPKSEEKKEEKEPAWKITGVADALYSWNANHPEAGINQLHNFDVNADAWTLASAALSIEHEGKWFNVHIDTGFGQLNKTMVASDQWHGPNQYIQQAYFGFKPFADKPFRIEAGKFFVPPAAEVPETYLNHNTTRSPLFVLGAPYYLLGVRAIIPVAKGVTTSVYLVNGWNDVIDDNTGKTFGATLDLVGKKQSFTAVYLVGPEKNDTNQGKRNFIDLGYHYTGKTWWNNYTELLWGGEARIAGPLVAPGKDVWYGVAHSTRFNLNRNWSLSPRMSWFMDRNGVTSGLPQRIIEMTGTVEYRLSKWIIARGELRRDRSNRQFFDADNHPSSSKTQDTALLGMTFLWTATR